MAVISAVQHLVALLLLVFRSNCRASSLTVISKESTIQPKKMYSNKHNYRSWKIAKCYKVLDIPNEGKLIEEVSYPMGVPC